MIKSFNDYYTLSNGVKIPAFGYGTWKMDTPLTAKSVKTALEAGYRHIDTASQYENEEGVRDGIAASGVKREDIFLTTKHWCDSRGYSKTIKALDDSLKRLGTDYVDLYLVHWPCIDITSDKWKEINAATWRGFEELYKQGKIRALGISNFLPEQILALEETAEILPTVNQIEVHPGYEQSALVEWCQKRNILLEAWSPLGSGAVLENHTLKKLAAKYNKTTAQICVRFVMQLGVLPLLKSDKKERMIDNTNVFDFALSDDDMAIIKTMPQSGFSGLNPGLASIDEIFPECNYDIE